MRQSELQILLIAVNIMFCVNLMFRYRFMVLSATQKLYFLVILQKRSKIQLFKSLCHSKPCAFLQGFRRKILVNKIRCEMYLLSFEIVPSRVDGLGRNWTAERVRVFSFHTDRIKFRSVESW